MYSLCAMFEWNFLPVAGGIYDQHPDLLRKFLVIRAEIDHEEKKKRAKQEREAKSKKPTTRGRRTAGHR